MTQGEASKLVFVGAGVTAAVVVATTQNEDDRFKALWAIGLLTIGLAAVADFAPQLAGPFAVLIAVAAVARHPGALGARLGFGAGDTRSFGRLGPRPDEGSRGGASTNSAAAAKPRRG